MIKNLELLGEVLGHQVLNILPILEKQLLLYNKGGKENWVRKSINIYELAHKYKEWAFHKSYQIETCYETSEKKTKKASRNRSYIQHIGRSPSRVPFLF